MILDRTGPYPATCSPFHGKWLKPLGLKERASREAASISEILRTHLHVQVAVLLLACVVACASAPLQAQTRHPDETLVWIQFEVPTLVALQPHYWDVDVGGLLPGVIYNAQLDIFREGSLVSVHTLQIHQSGESRKSLSLSIPIPRLPSGTHNLNLAIYDGFPSLDEETALLAARNVVVAVSEATSVLDRATKPQASENFATTEGSSKIASADSNSGRGGASHARTRPEQRIRHPEDSLFFISFYIPEQLHAHQPHSLNVMMGKVSPGVKYRLELEIYTGGVCQVVLSWEVSEAPSEKGDTEVTITIPGLFGGTNNLVFVVRDAYPGLDDQESLLAHRRVTFVVSEPTQMVDVTTKVVKCREEVLWGENVDVHNVANSITLVAVASIDRALAALHTAARWAGPLSFVFYARTELEESSLRQFVTDELGPFCDYRGQRLSALLVSMCHDDGLSSFVYSFPINKLRNAAIRAAATDLVLYTDVDFQPSDGVFEDLQAEEVIQGVRNGSELLILPCFMTAPSSKWPKAPVLSRSKDGRLEVALDAVSKELLSSALGQGWAQIPGAPHSYHSHAAVDYVHWVHSTSATPYEIPYTFWFEPYFVISKRHWKGLYAGLFDERFLLNGGDKAQLSYEAATLGYRFMVHPTALLVHVPESSAFACNEHLGSLCEVASLSHEDWEPRSSQAYFYMEVLDFIMSLPKWDDRRAKATQCFFPPHSFLSQLSREDAGGAIWDAAWRLGLNFRGMKEQLQSPFAHDRNRTSWRQHVRKWCATIPPLVGRMMQRDEQAWLIFESDALQGGVVEDRRTLIHYLNSTDGSITAMREDRAKGAEMGEGMTALQLPSRSECVQGVLEANGSWVKCRVLTMQQSPGQPRTSIAERDAWIAKSDGEAPWRETDDSELDAGGIHDDEDGGEMNQEAVAAGCIASNSQQRVMFWWLPVGGIAHTNESDVSITVFNPLQDMVYAGSDFPLTYFASGVPPSARIAISLDGKTASLSSSFLDTLLPAEPGMHLLSLSVLAQPEDDLSQERVLHEVVISFTVVAERLPGTTFAFPPMDTICRGFLPSEWSHKCRSSPSPNTQALIRVSTFVNSTSCCSMLQVTMLEQLQPAAEQVARVKGMGREVIVIGNSSELFCTHDDQSRQFTVTLVDSGGFDIEYSSHTFQASAPNCRPVQGLHSDTMASTETEEEPPVQTAFVSLAFNEAYLTAAMVMFHSIASTCQRKRDMVLLCVEGFIDRDVVEAAVEATSVKVRWVTALASPHEQMLGREELRYAYSKIHVWKLQEYSTVVYVDADVILYRCLDDLFNITQPFTAGTFPASQQFETQTPTGQWKIDSDALGFGTWTFVAHPSMETYSRLLHAVAESPSFDGSDGGFLYGAFPTRNLLPPFVVAWKRSVKFKSLWQRYRIYGIDFTGLPKPWDQRWLDGNDPVDGVGYFAYFLDWWENRWGFLQQLPHADLTRWNASFPDGALPFCSSRPSRPRGREHSGKPELSMASISELQVAYGLAQRNWLANITWKLRWNRHGEANTNGSQWRVVVNGTLECEQAMIPDSEVSGAHSCIVVLPLYGKHDLSIELSSSVVRASNLEKTLQPECDIAAQGKGEIWDKWMERYTEFHHNILRGWCSPRFLVYEAVGVKGIGNRIMAVASTLLAAALSNRAMLISWEHPVPLTRFLVPASFNWDLSDVALSGILDGLDRAHISSKEHCEQLLQLRFPLVVHDPEQLCPCCSLVFSSHDLLQAARTMLPQPRFAFFVGKAVLTLFSPSEELSSHLLEQWEELSQCGHAVAVQVRRGRNGVSNATSWYPVLDSHGEELAYLCAAKLAVASESTDQRTCFVVITDDPAARERAQQALAHLGRVMQSRASILHSGLDHDVKGDGSIDVAVGLRDAFVDWWVLGEVDDAVLSDISSFGYSSFSRLGRVPVTVGNAGATSRWREKDSAGGETDTGAGERGSQRGRGPAVCERRFWDQTGGPDFQYRNTAEESFPSHPRERAGPLPPLCELRSGQLLRRACTAPAPTP